MIITGTFVFLLALVFVLVWLFVNTIDKRKWLTVIISLALTPVVYFYVFYPMLNIFSSYHHQKHFNSGAWKENPELRYEMGNKILNDSICFGKNKNEIKSMLGESEWYSWDDALKANSLDKWNYNLGFKPGAFNTMQECLEIEFKQNKVVKVTPYQLEKTFE